MHRFNQTNFLLQKCWTHVKCFYSLMVVFKVIVNQISHELLQKNLVDALKFTIFKYIKVDN